jgi:ElaB/YqjD/DUF883 family membrane-anchored ribosome-binding protein
MSSVIEDVTERTLSGLGERAAAAAKEMFGPDAAEAVDRVTHRMVRRVHHEADRTADVIDGTALCIRRQPLKAVAVSVAGGLVMGVLVAAVFWRSPKRR